MQATGVVFGSSRSRQRHDLSTTDDVQDHLFLSDVQVQRDCSALGIRARTYHGSKPVQREKLHPSTPQRTGSRRRLFEHLQKSEGVNGMPPCRHAVLPHRRTPHHYASTSPARTQFVRWWSVKLTAGLVGALELSFHHLPTSPF